MLKKQNDGNGIGIDIVDVSRFYRFKKDKKHHFIKKTFSEREIDYCFKFKDPTSHLAGIFAVKEAVSKALGTENFHFLKLEICHRRDGAPQAWSNGKKLPLQISIAHTDTLAVAVAIF